MDVLNKQPEMIDLAIIGGGPAGSAAALEGRRRGLCVAIWERDRLTRNKVCGEFISAEALPFLQNEIPAVLGQGALIRRAEFIPVTGSINEFDFSQCPRGLSRRALDAALWSAAEAAGADARKGEAVRGVRKQAGSLRLPDVWEIESAGGIVQKARALLVACGRWWTLEGLFSPTQQSRRASARQWLGVKAHFSGVVPRDSVEMYFFRGGYCGIAPIENGLCNVCCLLNRERLQEANGSGLEDVAAWLKKIARHPSLEARLRGAVQVQPAAATFPVSLARRSAAHDGALLAGDASGFLDPFTGEGISMALHSGRLAAEVVAKSLLEGWQHERAMEFYRQSLSRAVQRSYRIALGVRVLMGAPSCVQNLAAAFLPWLGNGLVRETRWRQSPS